MAGLSALRGARPLTFIPKNTAGVDLYKSQYLSEVSRLQTEVRNLEIELDGLKAQRLANKLLRVETLPMLTPDQVKAKLKEFWTGHNAPVVLTRGDCHFALREEASPEFLYWLILELERSGPVRIRLKHLKREYPDTASTKAYLEGLLNI